MLSGMATGDPHLGTKIKRARERKRWTQQQLADAVGRNVKTVNNWETGRTEPASSLGAIEEVLGVNLSDGTGVEIYADPDEAEIWALTQFSPSERRALIEALRRARST
jgi:transcriptional regulator with XRE-family HTH domain